MSRYIDADALMRYMEERQERLKDDESLWELSVVETFLERVPSVDVVKVVRCKDCKNAHMTFDGLCKYCNVWTDSEGRLVELYHSGNNYCSYGVRKDGDGDE